MKILAHRGLCRKPDERNTYEAIAEALENGFGIESDIRDQGGRLVISHNIPDVNSFLAEKVFEKMASCGKDLCFAINIKADGLGGMLAGLLKKYAVESYFTFDMSVPQMVEYAENGLTFFTRQSEYETMPVLYEQAAGVWLDGFERIDWITEDLLKSHIANGKAICLVSPELHGKKDYRLFWERLVSWDLCSSKVLLCTDHPDEARDFFKDKLREKTI